MKEAVTVRVAAAGFPCFIIKNRRVFGAVRGNDIKLCAIDIRVVNQPGKGGETDAANRRMR